jgi:hypothetical protein
MKTLITIYSILSLFFSEKINQISHAIDNIPIRGKQLPIGDPLISNINTDHKKWQSKTDSIILLMSEISYVLEDSVTGLISCDAVKDTVLLFKNKTVQHSNLYLPYTLFVIFSKIGNQNDYHVERNDNVLSMNLVLGKQPIDSISAKCIIENRDLILQADYSIRCNINEQIRFKHEQYSRDGVIDCKVYAYSENINIDHDGLMVKSVQFNAAAKKANDCKSELFEKIDIASIDGRFSHFNHTELTSTIFRQMEEHSKPIQKYGQKDFDKMILQQILNNKLQTNTIFTIKTKKTIEGSLQKYIFQDDFFTDEFFKRNLKKLDTITRKITKEQLLTWQICLDKLNFEDVADPNLLESNFMYPLNKLAFTKKILKLYKQSDYGDAWNLTASTPKYHVALQMMYASWSEREKMYKEINSLKNELKKRLQISPD